ncbi:PilZ domain-containing protein [Magnetofaba australis]|uniref:Putative type IV pilus assembly PilZ n=1 Tax=Magnetofaba australis IT-1 TaxID=1434232 RepID=A0A1Y2KA29_9PROT|nr:PilZ domain-containing protein [Magnetofaba australis]OSM08621.1 putative type IV pilus assembly PilZ [Magnetofaba australis IT-1]
MAEAKSNSSKIFVLYGQSVINLFNTERADVDTCLLPIVRYNDSVDEERCAQFMAKAPSDELEEVQEAIKTLRNHLQDERHLTNDYHDDSESANAHTPFLNAYSDFKIAVRAGREEGMESNPFYHLLRAILRLNLIAIKKEVGYRLASTEGAQQVEPIPITPPPQIIWSRENRGASLLIRVSLTIKWFLIGLKMPLAALLFVFSSFTTFRGVSEVLQLPVSEQLFGALFIGEEGQNLRYLLGIVAGTVLSAAILGFKNRIFQAMAECGSVLKGVRNVFLYSPRFILLASLLTAVSIWTNYDGIVSVFSKQGDLANQATLIRSRVDAVLGKVGFGNPDRPQSLTGLQLSLELTARQAILSFNKLPEDELSGLASSSDPRKGPRYWAKHFIVYGGFQQGVMDLPSVYRNTTAARQVNDMLLSSGLDLSQPFENKIQRLVDRYAENLEQTRSEVNKLTKQLDSMMTLKSYEFDEVARLMALEHYDVNNLVRRITSHLERSKNLYDSVAAELNAIISTHVRVLEQVDKFGAARRDSYRISANVDVRPIEGIEALKKGVIPAATHKGLDELKRFLEEEHGLAMATFILTVILCLAISIDLADLLFFALFTARLGREDAKELNARQEDLLNWQKETATQLQSLFKTGEPVRIATNWLPTPSTISLRDVIFRCAQRWAPQTHHPQTLHPFRRFRYWMFGLFTSVRIEQIAIYNAWAELIEDLSNHRNKTNCVWNALFPGFTIETVADENRMLYEVQLSIESGIEETKENFSKFCQYVTKVTASPPTIEFRDLFQPPAQQRALLESVKKTAQKSTDEVITGDGFEEEKHDERPARSSRNRLALSAKSVRKTNSSLRSAKTPKQLLMLRLLTRTLYHKLFIVSFAQAPEPSLRFTRFDWVKSIVISTSESQTKLLAIKNALPEARIALDEIPQLRDKIIPETLNQLEGISETWGKTLRLSLRQYSVVLNHIEEESKRIIGIGKNCQSTDVVDISDNDYKHIETIMYDEKTASFTLLEQFREIQRLVLDAHQHATTEIQVKSKTREFVQEIHEIAMGVKRDLMHLKMNSVSSGRGGRWESMSGAQLHTQIENEVDQITRVTNELNESPTSDEGPEHTLQQLSQLHNRIKQLKSKVEDARMSVDVSLHFEPGTRVTRQNETPSALEASSADGQEIDHFEFAASAEPTAQTAPPLSHAPDSLENPTNPREMIPAPQPETIDRPSAPPTVQHLDSPQSEPPMSAQLEALDLPPELAGLFNAPQSAPSLAEARAPQPLAPSPQEIHPRYGQQVVRSTRNITPRKTVAPRSRNTMFQAPGAPESLTRASEPQYSGRQAERSAHVSQAELITEEGWVLQGETEDISITGVQMVIHNGQHGLQANAHGVFHLSRFIDEPGFPCRIVRVQGNHVMLTITEDTSRFGLLVMQEIFNQFTF